MPRWRHLRLPLCCRVSPTGMNKDGGFGGPLCTGPGHCWQRLAASRVLLLPRPLATMVSNGRLSEDGIQDLLDWLEWQMLAPLRVLPKGEAQVCCLMAGRSKYIGFTAARTATAKRQSTKVSGPPDSWSMSRRHVSHEKANSIHNDAKSKPLPRILCVSERASWSVKGPCSWLVRLKKFDCQTVTQREHPASWPTTNVSIPFAATASAETSANEDS